MENAKRLIIGLTAFLMSTSLSEGFKLLVEFFFSKRRHRMLVFVFFSITLASTLVLTGENVFESKVVVNTKKDDDEDKVPQI